jgi:NAD(P)-dependent dehydrogenase (short-subunit alcohol dehydrogenase family)
MTSPPAVSRAVLVTGAASGTGLSSGTGRATALRLHRAGWPVYATARNLSALDDLAEEGIKVLHLDTTDEKSMIAAVRRITEEHGAVGALINNAAYTLTGTVEETPIERVRHQFETNLIGPARLTQLVLPGMRAQGSGRIVFMSSVFGLFGTPGRGYYQGTKHGLEAIGDALRNEVAQFGIRVSVIEPSPILGGFIPTTVGDLKVPEEGQTGIYDEFWKKFVDWHEAYREKENPRGAGRLGVRAETVAKAIEHAVSSDNPRIRYRIGIPAVMLPRMRWMVGDLMFNKFVRSFFPTP